MAACSSTMRLAGFFIFVLATAFPQALAARTVEHSLTIAERTVTFAGQPRTGMTINGGIPGPVLRFREGDEAVLHVHNALDVPTSIHWHGMLLPPEMDGVPFVTFPPIQPGETYDYRFTIRQAGTYWYHSHSEFQEQLGVYGTIVILPKHHEHGADLDRVVHLSDWTNEDPHEVMRTLRRGSEWYAIERRIAQSALGAIKTRMFGKWLARETMRMPPMDIADVAYDAFLANGKREDFIDAKPGQKIRLRVVDGSASTFFHLHYAGGPLTIVTADGQPVEPVSMGEQPLLIGVAETYDVLVDVPGPGAYEFRATAHDGSGHTSVWIGSGERHPAIDLPRAHVYDLMMGLSFPEVIALTPAGSMGMPDYQVNNGKFDEPGMHMKGMMADMDHGGMNGMAHGGNGDMPGMSHGGKTHEAGGPNDYVGLLSMGGAPKPPVQIPSRWYDFLLREDSAHFPLLARDGLSPARPFPPYKNLRSTKKTAFPPGAPRRDVRLTLDGDMDRYVWMLNNRVLTPEDTIRIREGEVVRFIMINRTMMHHPMHLHGHFFRVINGQGDYAPLKHTVSVEPMSTTVFEFYAVEPGDWFFHCHLLYHMEAGMARVVDYVDFVPDAETMAVRDELGDDPFFFYGAADILHTQTQGRLSLSDNQSSFSASWEAGWHGVTGTTWEGEATYERFVNRFTSVFAGGYFEGVDDDVETDRAIAGFHYTLPFNVMASAWVDNRGRARVTFEREIMLTPRLGIFGEAEYDTSEPWAYQGGASYRLTKAVSATCLWDSDYGVGAGLTIRF